MKFRKKGSVIIKSLFCSYKLILMNIDEVFILHLKVSDEDVPFHRDIWGDV